MGRSGAIFSLVKALSFIHRKHKVKREGLSEISQEFYVSPSGTTIYSEAQLTNVEAPFMDKSEFQFPPSFFAVINDATCIPPFHIAKKGKYIIMESTLGREDWYLKSFHAQLLWRIKHPGSIFKKKSVPAMIVLKSFTSHNYFHWLIEILPRMMLLERHHQGDFLIGVPSKMPKWASDSLKAIGVDESSCYPLQNKPLKVKKLLVPSYPRVSARTDPEAMKWLRNKMINEFGLVASEKKSKVYISRRKAKVRHILNETELLDVIRPLGFKDYCLEDLSFKEQVALFYNCNYIIAPHGAGLSNSIFAENASIFEMFGENYVNPCYYHLASGLGFNYFYFVCQSAEAGQMKADVKAFKNAVNMLLESGQ